MIGVVLSNKDILLILYTLTLGKAFNSVPHVTLKEKFISYNYCQLTVGWITEFLTNRTQSLRVNLATSSAVSLV